MRPHFAGKFAELDSFVVDRIAGSVLCVRFMALTVMAVATAFPDPGQLPAHPAPKFTDPSQFQGPWLEVLDAGSWPGTQAPSSPLLPAQ